MASISSNLLEGLSRFPTCDNLKNLLEEFKKGISSNAFMEEDRGCDQSQAEANSTENINAESQYRTQAESTNEVEKPIEDKSQHSEKEHEPPVEIEEPTKEHHVADILNQLKEGSITDQSDRSKQDISKDTGKTEVTSETIVNVQKDEITEVTKANDSTKECDTDVTPMVEEQEIPAKSSMEESDATASETMMGNSNMKGQAVEKSIEERDTNPSGIVAEDSTMEDQVAGKQQEPEIDAESSIKEDGPKAPTDVNVQKDEITEVTEANDSTKECDTDVTPMVEEQQIPATASETLMGNSNMEGQDVEKSMEERVTKPCEIVAEDTTIEEQVVADPSETKAEDSTMEDQVAGKQQEPEIDAESSFKEDEPKAANETRADESNMPEKTNEEDKNEGRPPTQDSAQNEDLVSPYQFTSVNPKVTLSKDEKIVSGTLYAMTGPAWEPIFKSARGLPILYHFDMETITPNLEISTNVIDIWSEILNVMELYKEDMTLPSRYFFKISFINPLYFIEKHTDEEKLQSFTKSVDESFADDEKHLKTLETFDILFFPICRENHLYLICADFKNGSFRVIDNSSNGTDFKEKYKSIPEEILVQAFEKKSENERRKMIEYAIAHRDERERGL
ncbi:ulp1 protease family, C-terminal catalytic domain-containing protein [Artemisia annua]|uniref:Ulp1 protease family, C-terminal catalytic domain-containing protein n=1 Tax=Artemisia annua TaxID=35608 RepID=A0A2U1PEI5_ARTAN|nr:ulp1 protease family, C-terminal catalytic domain-containing protein [Artemisia annua]